jgi:hypothetical protein
VSGNPWSKFFWADWESDPALKLCSLAAQGLWMRMLCIAASHDPIGYVAVAGRGLEGTDLARMTGASEPEVDALVGELVRNGVCSRDAKGRFYSRRMIRDARRSAEARKNGKLGGNPSLAKVTGKARGVKGSDKTGDKGGDKPHNPEARGSVSNDTGAGEPPPDPVKVMFDAGAALLSAAGVSDRNARSVIGRWRRERGDGWTMDAITAARRGAVSNPVEWIEKRSRNAAGGSPGAASRGIDATAQARALHEAAARRYAAMPGKARAAGEREAER